MDIFSHGLWAGAAAKAANKKLEASTTVPGGDSSCREVSPQGGFQKLNFWHAVWWGLFPDLFAFTPAFIGLFWLLFAGQMSWSEWPGRHGGEPAVGNSLFVFQLAGHLYNFSHSIFVFALVFCIVWFIRSRLAHRASGGLPRRSFSEDGPSPRQSGLQPREGGPQWEMGGWLLHILMDIPTHSYAFFPTPLFWPLFGWKFDGFSWAQPWFLLLNYGLLIFIYWFLRKKSSRQK